MVKKIKHLEHIQKLCSTVNGFFCVVEETKAKIKDGQVKWIKPFFKNTFYPTDKIDLKKILGVLVKRSKEGITFHGSNTFFITNESRRPENISHFFNFFFDIDNVVYKNNSKKTTKLKDDTLADMYAKLSKFLDDLGLLDFATLIVSGSGLHCHFYLDKIVSANTSSIKIYKRLYKMLLYLFWVNHNGIYSYGAMIDKNEGEKYIEADKQCIYLTKATKIFPGTIARRENEYSIEISCIHEAKRYLSFTELKDIIYSAWEKKYRVQPQNIYFKTISNQLQCFEAQDENELKTVYRDFTKENKPKSYSDIKQALNGERIWTNDDMTKIFIDDEGIYYQDEKVKKRSKGKNNFKQIQTGYILYPKYRYKKDKDIWVYEIQAVNSKEEKFISITTDDFKNAEKLQSAFNSQMIDISVDKAVKDALFSYFKTHSEEIELVDISFSNRFLAHYNFVHILGEKKTIKLFNRHFTYDDKIYIINDEYAGEMTSNNDFVVDEKVNYNNIFTEFYELLRKTYKDTNIVNLYFGFLLVTIRRIDWLKHFNDIPGLILSGVGSTGKSSLLNFAADIFNMNTIKDPTIYNLYRKQQNLVNFPIFIDDLQNIDNDHKMVEFLKHASTNHKRDRMRAGKVGETDFRCSVFATTNFPPGDEALSSRYLKLRMEEKHKTSADTYFKLKEFVDKNAYHILIALYTKMYSIDFNILLENTKILSKSLIEKLENSRLADMYSIVLSTLIEIGININIDVYIDEALKKEKSYNTDLSTFVDFVVEFIFKELKEQPQGDIGFSYIDLNHIPRNFLIKFTDFSIFLKWHNYENYLSAIKLSRKISNYEFMTRAETTANGKHGLFYQVDLTNRHFNHIFFDNGNGAMTTNKNFKEKPLYERNKYIG